MYFAIVVYALAIIGANLIVAATMQHAPAMLPAVTTINAFMLIGFDLALRDFLQVVLRPKQMFGLIAVTGALTYLLNPAAGIIAVASAVAFSAAALVDWAVFVKTPGTWLQRSNASNVAGAAVDSLLFPTIAFGALMPQIVIQQFIAKVFGGAIWSWCFSHFRKA